MYRHARGVGSFGGLGLLVLAMTWACGGDTPSGLATGGSSGGSSGEGGAASADCENGVQDPGEVDVDCGGGCPACLLGQSCSVAGDCASGFCVDGVCCDGECAGTCEACDVAGSEGTCAAYEAGTDPEDECSMSGGAESCDGAAACHCSNGAQDLDEQAIDCGGMACGPCYFYFAGKTSAEGVELWRTDGTEAGTALVKDIAPGSADSAPEQFHWADGVTYFHADDGTHGRELWRTDGTDAGTALVKDLNPGTADGVFGLMGRPAVLNGELYFRGDDGVSGAELWKTDGTDAGTIQLADVHPTSSSGTEWITAFAGAIYFAASDGFTSVGYELWKSDGTPAGTELFIDILPGSAASSPWELVGTPFGLFFVASDGQGGKSIFRSDGTVAGTNSYGGAPEQLTPMGDAVYFISGCNVLGLGATGNVQSVLSTTGNNCANPNRLAATSNALFFEGTSPATDFELWISDGTEAGTSVVDIRAGGNSSPERLTAAGDNLFFLANDGISGRELWVSDGTVAGTVMAKDFLPGPSGGGFQMRYFWSFRGQFLFAANDQTTGFELWTSDGTDAGTVQVKDICPGPCEGIPLL